MRNKRTAAIKVRVDDATKLRLAAEAHLEGVDLSDVVRRAIALYLAKRIRAVTA